MSYQNLLILLLINVGLAIGIAIYQQKNGYKFLKSFIGALIGLIGLSALILKVIIEL